MELGSSPRPHEKKVLLIEVLFVKLHSLINKLSIKPAFPPPAPCVRIKWMAETGRKEVRKMERKQDQKNKLMGYFEVLIFQEIICLKSVLRNLLGRELKQLIMEK